MNRTLLAGIGVVFAQQGQVSKTETIHDEAYETAKQSMAKRLTDNERAEATRKACYIAPIGSLRIGSYKFKSRKN